MKGFAQKLIEKAFKKEKEKRVKPRHVANPGWEKEQNPDKFLKLRVVFESDKISSAVFRFDPAQTVGEVLNELSALYGLDPLKVGLFPAEQKVGEFDLKKIKPKAYDQSKTLSQIGLKNKTFVKVGIL